MTRLKITILFSLIVISLALAGCQGKSDNKMTEDASPAQQTPQTNNPKNGVNQTLPEYSDISSDIAEIMQLLNELEELDNVSFEI
jgi:outer membrane murein-binding lipoprotein Lpp